MDPKPPLDRTFRLVRPLSLGPESETWLCTVRGRPRIGRHHAGTGASPSPPPSLEVYSWPHPRLERLVSVHRAPDGGIWHLFRVVPGESLRDALRLGPWDLARWLRVLADLADGLAWLHHRSPVSPRLHGDVSPGNVMITPRGRGVLVDLQGLPALPAPGQPTVLRGTLPYLADEVLAGCRPTPASEVAALGWMTCRVLGWLDPPGQVPVPKDLVAARRRALEEVRCPEPLRTTLLLPLLDPDPLRRPSAEEVRRRARALLAHLPSLDRPSRPEPP